MGRMRSRRGTHWGEPPILLLLGVSFSLRRFPPLLQELVSNQENPSYDEMGG
jgi:hypothetical protein